MSAVGSFQRQISFAVPFWCGGRAGREVLCALAYTHPACRSARRLLTSSASDELLCGRQFCGGWTPRRVLRGDSARYVAIRGVARSSVLPGFAVRRRCRLSGQGRQSLSPVRTQPSEGARQRRHGGVHRASGCSGHIGSWRRGAMTWCWCAPAAGRRCARPLLAALPLLLLGPARGGRKSRKAAQAAVRRRRWLSCHPLQLSGRSHGLHGAPPAAQLLLRLLCGGCGVANDCC